MWPSYRCSVVCTSVCLSVCQSINVYQCLLTTTASCAKTEETIEMTFWRRLMGPGCLGSRVVSVLDSGTEGPGSNRRRDAVG